ncbi:MAG: hypothetical protein KAH17_01130 [Bacteroidales bacterium]|nr:hypothetical protein [Bacteroidales bacterium]
MIKRSFFLLGAIFLIVGCVDYGSYVKTDIDINFPINLDVVVENPGMKSSPAPFDVTKSVNLAGDAALANYVDNIRGIVVNDLTATVTGLDQNVVLTNATLTISGNDQSVSWDFENISITNDVILELPNDNQEFDTLSTMLSALGDVEVQFAGFSDTSDIQYTLAVVLNTTVTVGL